MFTRSLFQVYDIYRYMYFTHNGNQGESTLQGIKIVVRLYCFARFPCLNFKHVIIMKDFHNVFAYYDKSKLKEVKCQKKNSFLNFIWCDVRVYLGQKYMSQHIKNWKYNTKKDWNYF